MRSYRIWPWKSRANRNWQGEWDALAFGHDQARGKRTDDFSVDTRGWTDVSSEGL